MHVYVQEGGSRGALANRPRKGKAVRTSSSVVWGCLQLVVKSLFAASSISILWLQKAWCRGVGSGAFGEKCLIN